MELGALGFSMAVEPRPAPGDALWGQVKSGGCLGPPHAVE